MSNSDNDQEMQMDAQEESEDLNDFESHQDPDEDI